MTSLPPSASKLRKSVTVRVPATSANMGPGFDAVGIALNIYNDLTVSTVDPVTGTPWTSFDMQVEGEGAATLPRDPANNLVCVALELAFREAGWTMGAPPLHYTLVNRIPVGAGLGSSSAAIVAGLLAGLALTGHSIAVKNEEKALQLAATVEGHVDNLAPCIYGGMQIGVHTGERWYTTSVSVPTGLQCILFIPDKRQDTEGARAILPKQIPREDAVYNIGRVALLINAFASGQLDDLFLATQDALHQPARAHIMPWLTPCVEAAKKAGAKGAFLSGAGSSIMAITTGRKGDIHGQRPTERRDIEVAKAMAKAAHAAGYSGRVLITQPTQLGGHVTEFDGDGSAVISGRGLGVDLLADDDDDNNDEDDEDDDEEEEQGQDKRRNKKNSSNDDTHHHGAGSGSASSSTSSATTGVHTSSSSSSTSSSVKYISTRGTSSSSSSPSASPPSLTFSQAVFAGLAPDGGLYVPSPSSVFPHISQETLSSWAFPQQEKRESQLSYAEVATRVMSLFISEDEIPLVDLRNLCTLAYSGVNAATETPIWASPEVAPVISIPFIDTSSSATSSGTVVHIAEHFHGPTAAFKDLALQFLGHLFEYLLTKNRNAQSQGSSSSSSSSSTSAALPTRLTILGATSGDTGAAAIAGLAWKRGVEVFILHPAGRVAKVQELQMTSCLSANVHNMAVEGADFDACQAAVKASFSDAAFRAKHSLSAINSINWARILAQTVYYVWTYIKWVQQTRTSSSSSSLPLPQVTFVVPTGNFGNALSAYYAKKLGIPIANICVATNANDIMHRFISTGDFSCNNNNTYNNSTSTTTNNTSNSNNTHTSQQANTTTTSIVPQTLAPSMDIQVPSNLERYLYQVAFDTALKSRSSTTTNNNNTSPSSSAGADTDTAYTIATEQVRAWMSELSRTQRVKSFPSTLLEAVRADFTSAAADDSTIDKVIQAYLQPAGKEGGYAGYAVCPHTACGLHAVSVVESVKQRVVGVAGGGSSSSSVVVMATAHPAKFASATPSLAAAGLYYPEVEGSLAKPVVPVKNVSGGSNSTSMRPLLPPQLRSLCTKTRQCATVPNSLVAIKAYVDNISASRV